MFCMFDYILFLMNIDFAFSYSVRSVGGVFSCMFVRCISMYLCLFVSCISVGVLMLVMFFVKFGFVLMLKLMKCGVLGVVEGVKLCRVSVCLVFLML